jgi:hypothetical protein
MNFAFWNWDFFIFFKLFFICQWKGLI